MCVGYLCGLHAGIPLCLKVFSGSGEHNSSEKSSVCEQTCIFATYDLPFVHRYILDGSGCETEGVCVGYLCGLDSGIPLCLKLFGGSGEHKTSGKSRV